MEHKNSTVTLVKWNQRSLVPSKWEDTIRVVDVTEAAEAGRSLAHSFATDALCQYLLDGDDMAGLTDEHKWKLHVDFMTYMVAGNCYKGIVTAIGPDYEALALWLPPGETTDDWWTVFRSGTWRLYYQLSAEGRRRYHEEIIPVLHQTKEQVMGERDSDCYYLAYIGTKPNARGKGYAGKLIRDMTKKVQLLSMGYSYDLDYISHLVADIEHRPIYLESSSVDNNGYYAKFGFELRRDIAFGGGPDTVKLYIMVREPQTPKSTYAAQVMIQVGGRLKV
ncbi:hypothetical protein G7046_g8547 [Stylonectria norvegica]|nr:hypothetical protein G7046_g8547 [Stylonectria norvegica]